MVERNTGIKVETDGKPEVAVQLHLMWDGVLFI